MNLQVFRPAFPKAGPTLTDSFSQRAPFSRALRNPPCLTSCPCITMLHLDAIDLLGSNPRSFLHRFSLPLSRLFSLSLWAAQRLAKNWDLSKLLESGEWRALWHGVLLFSLASW